MKSQRCTTRPPPFDHGRVVGAAGPAIEIAPLGLRPVVPLQGRYLYHAPTPITRPRRRTTGRRPRAPNSFGAARILRGAPMECAPTRYHAAPLNERPPPVDHGCVVGPPGPAIESRLWACGRSSASAD